MVEKYVTLSGRKTAADLDTVGWKIKEHLFQHHMAAPHSNRECDRYCRLTLPDKNYTQLRIWMPWNHSSMLNPT